MTESGATQLVTLPPQSGVRTTADPGALPGDLLRYGYGALAYSCVADPSVESFQTPYGTVLYGKIDTPFGERTLVAGDPLAAPGALPHAIRAFLRRHPGASFFQVTRPVAEVVRRFGYRVTHLGLEMRVPLRMWSPSGRDQQNLRTALNRARREGLEVIEARSDDFGAHALMRLSAAWKKTKTLRNRELAFFARPAVYADEPAVRKFFAVRGGEPRAFVAFDPLFRDGRAFGYAANILRQDPREAPGLCDAVILHAARQFKSEGLEQLNLGMLPFCPPPAGHDSPRGPLVSRLIVDTNWKLLNHLFNHRGIAFHKRRWRGEEEPVYYAGKPFAAVKDFLGAARITGLL
jgi:phosphatidylglycerol lysyltransferase